MVCLDPEYKLHQVQQLRKSPSNTNTHSLNPKKRLSPKSSPVRRPRGDTKKCRKVSAIKYPEILTYFQVCFNETLAKYGWHVIFSQVYGMDRRDLWCTQCKWKKACTRFGDQQLLPKPSSSPSSTIPSSQSSASPNILTKRKRKDGPPEKKRKSPSQSLTISPVAATPPGLSSLSLHYPSYQPTM